MCIVLCLCEMLRASVVSFCLDIFTTKAQRTHVRHGEKRKRREIAKDCKNRGRRSSLVDSLAAHDVHTGAPVFIDIEAIDLNVGRDCLCQRVE